MKLTQISAVSQLITMFFYGASNRIEKVLLKIQADYFIAIESGFFEHKEEFFIGTVAQIFDTTNSSISLGVSNFYKIPASAFDCIKNGMSLNEIIVCNEKLGQNSKVYKQNSGVLGFLTNDNIDRKQDAFQALTHANAQNFDKMKYDETEECLSMLLKQNIIDQERIHNLTTKNYHRLETACNEALIDLYDKR